MLREGPVAIRAQSNKAITNGLFDMGRHSLLFTLVRQSPRLRLPVSPEDIPIMGLLIRYAQLDPHQPQQECAD